MAGRTRRIRVADGTTRAQIYARLTQRQQAAADKVAAQQREVNRAQVMLGAASAVLYRRMVDALEDGVPARLLADELGVTTSRIYQIAREFAAGLPVSSADGRMAGTEQDSAPV